MTFNGNDNEIVESNCPNIPVRRCPGRGYALDIIEFLVDRYLPPIEPPIDIDMSQRLDEIASRESFFMKFVLFMGKVTYAENNKYFPHASEVIHPMDTAGRKLGATKILAAGGRMIPQHGKPPYRFRRGSSHRFDCSSDEDVKTIDALKDSLTGLVLRFAPITDDEGEWQSVEEAVKWRMNWFSSNFPPVNVRYTESCTNMATLVSNLAFSGLCCLRTKRVDSYPETSVVRKESNGAVYVNDNTPLGAYRVRRGYQRYGAAAYFDEDCHLVGIYTCCDSAYFERPENLVVPLELGSADDKLDEPKYDKWRHAMWAWRVSALTMATVSDHLVNVHMVDANSLVSASRKHLPISHPMRCFLKIFTFRTVAINSKAHKTLIDRKGIVNRNWAFETDDLQELISETKVLFKKDFKDYIPPCMIEAPNYPVNEDIPAFKNIIHGFVEGYIRLVYDAPSTGGLNDSRLQRSIDADVHLQDFLRDLSRGLGIDKRQELTSFADIV